MNIRCGATYPRLPYFAATFEGKIWQPSRVPNFANSTQDAKCVDPNLSRYISEGERESGAVAEEREESS